MRVSEFNIKRYTKMTKPYGYWNDIEKCRDEAKKYNGRYEFQLNSYGAYNSALRHNWLNEICCNYDNSIKYIFRTSAILGESKVTTALLISRLLRNNISFRKSIFSGKQEH